MIIIQEREESYIKPGEARKVTSRHLQVLLRGNLVLIGKYVRPGPMVEWRFLRHVCSKRTFPMHMPRILRSNRFDCHGYFRYTQEVYT